MSLSSFGADFIADFHTNVQVNGESPELNFRGTGYMFIADTEALYDQLEEESHDQLAMGAEVDVVNRDVANGDPGAEFRIRFPTTQ